jgi:hypothetical protein
VAAGGAAKHQEVLLVGEALFEVPDDFSEVDPETAAENFPSAEEAEAIMNNRDGSAALVVSAPARAGEAELDKCETIFGRILGVRFCRNFSSCGGFCPQ